MEGLAAPLPAGWLREEAAERLAAAMPGASKSDGRQFMENTTA